MQANASASTPIELSVIAPIYNEAGSIPHLIEALLSTLDASGHRFEIILVNDGSTDGSAAKLASAAQARREIKVIEFRRNFGQTAALMAGIDYSVGSIIVTIDA